MQRMRRNKTLAQKSPLNVALHKLSYRAYTRYELTNILLSCGYENDDVEKAIARVMEWGYLNDLDIAEQILNNHIKYRPCGTLLIKKRMLSRGISPEIIETVFQDYSDLDEYNVCFELAQKYLFSKSAENKEMKTPLCRYLYRKGFSSAIIQKTIYSLTDLR